MTQAIDGAGAADGEARVRARRFDADRHDEIQELDDALATPPSERQLLWIDIQGPMPDGLAERLAETFHLDEATAGALADAPEAPALVVHGAYLNVTVVAEPDPSDPRHSPWLTAVAEPNLVVTRHARRITFLDELDQQVEADTSFGLLDSQSFLATLLGVTVTSYLRAVDAIEEDVERLDVRSLRDRGQRDLLEDLVELRTRVAVMGRLVAKHRFVDAGRAGLGLG